jgi:hypothetical protein
VVADSSSTVRLTAGASPAPIALSALKTTAESGGTVIEAAPSAASIAPSPYTAVNVSEYVSTDTVCGSVEFDTATRYSTPSDDSTREKANTPFSEARVTCVPFASAGCSSRSCESSAMAW